MLEEGTNNNSGVIVDFVVGLSDPTRAELAAGLLASLAVRNPQLQLNFVGFLQAELELRTGTSAYDFAVEFTPPTTKADSSSAWLPWSASNESKHDKTKNDPKTSVAQSSKISMSTFVLVMLASITITSLLLLLRIRRNQNSIQKSTSLTNYGSKVADAGETFGLEGSSDDFQGDYPLPREILVLDGVDRGKRIEE